MNKNFDLNIDKILENWELEDALREIISNAIDEQKLTNTRTIQINKDEVSGCWEIRDFGRGLRYEHFVQNENEDKVIRKGIIGKFGVGLKDALATFDRKSIRVLIYSRYGNIQTVRHPKSDFSDIETLHARITPPTDPDMHGTLFRFFGITDSTMQKALQYFLQFQTPNILDETEYGEIIERVPSCPAYIYINGVRVATEENFLFSYNITHINKAISKALNRERTNVGRTAYTSTIQKILTSTQNEDIISLMSEDLQQYSKGTVHDELKWMEVQMHTTRQLNKNKNVVFVTAEEIHKHTDLVNDVTTAAKMVIVPENLAAKMQSANEASLPTEAIRTLSHMVSERASNFTSSYIPLEELTEHEKRVYNDGIKIFQLLGGCDRVKEIRISEKMQFDTTTFMECIGLWSPSEGYITICRSQLQDRTSFLATLLHELSHAVSQATDATRDFEWQLTKYLGILANRILG